MDVGPEIHKLSFQNAYFTPDILVENISKTELCKLIEFLLSGLQFYDNKIMENITLMLNSLVFALYTLYYTFCVFTR